jgi:dipeptide/tripeptide permease
MENKPSEKLEDINYNFNITWKNLKYVLPLIVAIFLPVVLKIDFGLTAIGNLIAGLIIVVILYRIPWSKAPKSESKKVNEKRQNIVAILFAIFVVALFIFAINFESSLESFLVNTLGINPDTALDSIRLFLGIH